MARHNYSSAKRQKELKKQKRQQEKKLKKETQSDADAAQDEQALINEYLGIAPDPAETTEPDDESTD